MSANTTPSPLRGGRLNACVERGGGIHSATRATPTPLGLTPESPSPQGGGS
jgi:hypothetical protein